MTRILCILAITASALLGGALHADGPVPCGRAFWSVPTVESVPEPAALLSPDGWPQAAAFTGLHNLSSGNLSRNQPVFWIARDATRLIVGWTVPTLKGAALSKGVVDHDGHLWNDDTVEIFLDPGHTHSDYFQFMINANGTRGEARVRDQSWNGEWEARVTETADAWAGQASIPFATLGIGVPDANAVWAANFGVDRSPMQRPVDGWEVEEPNLTWSRLGSGSTFHEPVSFGHLIFRPADRVQITGLGDPWGRALRVQGTSSSPVTVEVFTAAERDAVWTGSDATDGEQVDIPVPGVEPGEYIASLTASGTDGKLASVPVRFQATGAVDGRIETFALAREMTVQARVELPDPPAASRIQARLVDGAGQVVRDGMLAMADGRSEEVLRWSFADLQAGEYRLALEDPERPELSSSIPWSLPARPAWLGSSAGLFGDDHVLKPWTPLRVLGRDPLRVACWGREYGFARGGLLGDVQALGKPILSGPMALDAVMNGEQVALRAEPVQITKTAAGAVEFQTTQSGGGLEIACEGRMEFDGFVKLRLRVTGAPDAPDLDALTLSIPFRAEVARLLHNFPKPSVWVGVDVGRLNAHAVTAEDWASPFLYYVWVGDEEEGLQWLCETEENWRPADPAKAIELIHEGPSTTLRLNLIGRPTKLDEPREYEFAFQASPVKPTPEDYRHWGYAQLGGYGIEKAPYSPKGLERSVTYPAAGNISVERGTVEVTITPTFDSTAPGELNRSLFLLHWPVDTRPEPEKGAWIYWNQDDRGMRVVHREHDEYEVIYGSTFAWKPGETHTVAFTWGEDPAIFIDAQKMVGLPAKPLFRDPVDLSDAVLRLGDVNSDFIVSQFRISDTIRPAEELGAGAEPMAVDEHTLLFDRFDAISGNGELRQSRPAKIANAGIGRITPPVRQVPEGLDLSRPPFTGTRLDYYKGLGLKFLGFHEHWTDLQGFPRTSHTEELKSLIAGCHEKDLKLMLYQSWQLSDTAPEYPLYLRECEIIHPQRFIYTRQPKQTDYPVCARSAWSDFMADGIQTLFADFGHDGIYSDGLSYPGECSNALHGCGYVGEDGVRYPTYSLFAVRDAMKRFRYILEQQGKETLFVCHTSGAITLPTLAFADAYLDGEHLCGLPRPLRVPLDSFRAEFMGHNFGIPAYFLVYQWYGGMTDTEGLALSVLHDTELPWSFEHMAPVWRAWDEFGVDQSRFQGYWDNAQWLAEAPEGVEVSAYLRPDSERLLVAVNTGEAPVEGTLRLRDPIATARDVLGDKPVTVADGAIQMRLLPWRLNLLQVTPEAP